MFSLLHKKFKRRWFNFRCFAAVVRSPAYVRDAFSENRVLAWWWSAVLTLHGKPDQRSFPNYGQSIAEGFQFYGVLYRLLAVVLASSALICWRCEIAGFFSIAALLLGGIYLWIVTGLAFCGASEFLRSNGDRTWKLVAFLFFIAVFLSSLLTELSFQVRGAGLLSDGTNLFITAVMMAFGVGSYVIELAALANKPNGRVQQIHFHV